MDSPLPSPTQPNTWASTYPVVETFHSIQGEGYWTGVSAFFIRLAGCDVGCPWCDTKVSWPVRSHPQVALQQLVRQVQTAQPQIIVVTGGEPLMHDLSLLSQALKTTGCPLHLETSGAYPLSGAFDWITLSPKPTKPPHSELYSQAHELKVVIHTETDFVWAEQQAAHVTPQIYKFLQPEWSQPRSQALVWNYVLQQPQWRVSLQTHKFLQVR
ncbi:MAG: 7-carboxy-7-deazaguanine synthase QueE [Spirulina sp. SIO3F2]|nr:7-carboxy-7-deazaguanine synthase QueE [Spirulina sp. SIO3F2]